MNYAIGIKQHGPKRVRMTPQEIYNYQRPALPAESPEPVAPIPQLTDAPAQPTQGEWIVGTLGYGVTKFVMLKDTSVIIAEAKERYLDLIAASPDLLAACEALLKFNEELCQDVNVSIHYPSATKARAAIAKAKGAQVTQ